MLLVWKSCGGFLAVSLGRDAFKSLHHISTRIFIHYFNEVSKVTSLKSWKLELLLPMYTLAKMDINCMSSFIQLYRCQFANDEWCDVVKNIQLSRTKQIRYSTPILSMLMKKLEVSIR